MKSSALKTAAVIIVAVVLVSSGSYYAWRRPPAATPPGNQTMAAADAPKAVAGAYVTRAQLANVGYATPEAAMLTRAWAMLAGSFDAMVESFPPDKRAQVMSGSNRAIFESAQKEASPDFIGLQIMARKDLPDGKVELKVKVDDKSVKGGQTSELEIQIVGKIGGEWRVISERPYTPSWD